MKNDGKRLENLVGFIEKLHLPPGLKVKLNKQVFNDEGVSIAEFDIEITGKVGTGSYFWLIECRDRPNHGPAPASWIEQLVGRRTRFGINKVTAVSTTGFSAGAAEFGKASGIELREVETLEPDAFADWLHVRSLTQRLRIADLHHAELLGGSNGKERAALQKFLFGKSGDLRFLRSIKNGDVQTAQEAFRGVIDKIPDAFSGLVPNGEPKKVDLEATYLKDDHFVVDIRKRVIPIQKIRFRGELRIQDSQVPIVETAEYRHAESGEAISQLAAFAPQTLPGITFSLELHRLIESGDTQIVIRRLDTNSS